LLSCAEEGIFVGISDVEAWMGMEDALVDLDDDDDEDGPVVVYLDG